MLISWSSGFEILIFLYQMKARNESFILSSTVRDYEMQSLRYEENPKGVAKNKQARRCTEKFSYPG